jgi:hypothetical protein
MAIWYILWSFGIFSPRFSMFYPKNLATLIPGRAAAERVLDRATGSAQLAQRSRLGEADRRGRQVHQVQNFRI